MNILLISPVFPFPPDDGDRLRVFNFIRELSKKHGIFLACFAAKGEEKHIDAVKKYCRSVSCIPITKAQITANAARAVFSKMPINAAAYKNRKMKKLVSSIMSVQKIDLVFAYRLRMAQYARDTDKPKVIDIVDSLALYNRRRKEFEKNIFTRLYMAIDAPRIESCERALAEIFDYIFINSEQDREFLGAKNIITVPNGVDRVKAKKTGKKNAVFTMGFFGNMAYPPNMDAILYFYRNAWKKLSAMDNNIKLVIAGKGSERLKNLAGNNVVIKGYVDDMVPEISSWDLSLVPVRYGAGRQNKIMLSWLAGVPVLATPFAAAGVYGKDMQNILIAENENDFIKKITLIKGKPALAKKLASSATKTLKKNFDWKKSAGIIEKYLRKAL